MSDGAEEGLFRSAVRGSLGLREAAGTTPGDPSELWRYGIYRATVQAAAANGSTVDVDVEDGKLPRMQAVPLRQPFPGATVVPTTGSIVHVGWEAGREDRPYAFLWESGDATKIVINADLLHLSGDTYSLLQTETLLADLKAWVTAMNIVIGSNCVNGSTLTSYVAQSAAITLFKTQLDAAGAYLSTVVKNA